MADHGNTYKARFPFSSGGLPSDTMSTLSNTPTKAPMIMVANERLGQICSAHKCTSTGGLCVAWSPAMIPAPRSTDSTRD